jgi:tetratricopeptide (TPR) repeat protein
LAAPSGVSSSVYEDDALRDGSVELERARGEFRLGHLEAATQLLDALAIRLRPRLNCPAEAAIYAASRVLDARIHEQQKRTGECQTALSEAMEAYCVISGDLDHISTRAFGDYGIALEMLGRHQEAADWLQRAREKGLDMQATFHYLGLAQKALGNPDAALTLAEAEKRDEEDRVAIVAMGDVLAARGDNQEAAEAYWRASVSALVHDSHEEALQLIDASSRLRLENAKDVGVRAAILWRLGRFPEALRQIERAIEIAPPNLIVKGHNLVTGAWRVKGRILLQMQRWQEALDAFAKATAQDPDNTVALAGQAKALVHLGRCRDALPLLDRALKREPCNVGFLVDKAVALRNLEQTEEALKLTEQALQLDPDSICALDVCGQVLRQRGEFKDAASRFRRITELDPSLLDAWLDLGDALRQAGRAQEALEAIDKAVGRFSKPAAADVARIQTARGQALRDLGRFPEAVEAFQQSCAVTPDLPGFLGLVDTLRQLQEYERAFAAVEDYLAKKDPAPLEVILRKAHLLCDTGEFTQAFEILRPIETKDAAVFALRGWALENQGLEFGQRALAEYQQAYLLEPSNPFYKYHVASSLRLLGEVGAAAEIYTEIAGLLAERRASLKPWELWLLGWCHLCLGRQSEAIRYLTAAESAGPGAFPHFDLALAFLCDGRLGLAEREYRNAIELVKLKNRLWQRGVLLVAVQDLMVASRLEQKIPQAISEEIIESLRQALAEARRYPCEKGVSAR